MPTMTPAKLQPALLGGLTIGVLSALPVINLANCCCAWILFGGALAAYLMQQSHPEPITSATARSSDCSRAWSARSCG